MGCFGGWGICEHIANCYGMALKAPLAMWQEASGAETGTEAQVPRWVEPPSQDQQCDPLVKWVWSELYYPPPKKAAPLT